MMEVPMRSVLTVIFAALLTVGGVATLSVAEEELFDSKAAQEHLEKGIALLGARNYDGAIEEFEEAVSAAPSAEAYYRLGYAYYMKGKSGDEDSRQKSIESFEQAYDIDPNYSPNPVGPAEVIEAPRTGQEDLETPAAAAPAGALAPGAAAPQPEAPAPPAAQ
jgi:tetratricopeptide (TPR) repeat protein